MLQNYKRQSQGKATLTQGEGDVVTHSQQLAEADDSVQRVDAVLPHLIDRVAHSLLVVGGDHDGNLEE